MILNLLFWYPNGNTAEHDIQYLLKWQLLRVEGDMVVGKESNDSCKISLGGWKEAYVVRNILGLCERVSL